jgi:hypothetical protein
MLRPGKGHLSALQRNRRTRSGNTHDAASSFDQRKVSPVISMRCIRTANFRATATLAFFRPIRFARRADVGAEIRVWSDFTLSRGGQAIRRDTGMPRLVMRLRTVQATLASVFCVGRVRAWRLRAIKVL